MKSFPEIQSAIDRFSFHYNTKNSAFVNRCLTTMIPVALVFSKMFIEGYQAIYKYENIEVKPLDFKMLLGAKFMTEVSMMSEERLKMLSDMAGDVKGKFVHTNANFYDALVPMTIIAATLMCAYIGYRFYNCMSEPELDEQALLQAKLIQTMKLSNAHKAKGAKSKDLSICTAAEATANKHMSGIATELEDFMTRYRSLPSRIKDVAIGVLITGVSLMGMSFGVLPFTDPDHTIANFCNSGDWIDNGPKMFKQLFDTSTTPSSIGGEFLENYYCNSLKAHTSLTTHHFNVGMFLFMIGGVALASNLLCKPKKQAPQVVQTVPVERPVTFRKARVIKLETQPSHVDTEMPSTSSSSSSSSLSAGAKDALATMQRQRELEAAREEEQRNLQRENDVRIARSQTTRSSKVAKAKL